MSVEVYRQFEILLEELKSSKTPSEIVTKLQEIDRKLTLHIDRIDTNVVVQMGYADYFCQAISREPDNELQLDCFLRVLINLSYADSFALSNNSRLVDFLEELTTIIGELTELRSSTDLCPSILWSSFWIISNILKNNPKYLVDIFPRLVTALTKWADYYTHYQSHVFRSEFIELVDTISCCLTWENFDHFGVLATKLVTRDRLLCYADSEGSSTCKIVYNLMCKDYRRTLILFPWLLSSLPELLEITLLTSHQRKKDDLTPFYILRSLSPTDDAITEQLVDLGCLEALKSAISSREEQLQLDALFVLSNFYLCKEYNITQRMIDEGCFSQFNCTSEVINKTYSVLLEILYMAECLFWSSTAMQLNQLDAIGVLDFVFKVIQTLEDCVQKRKFSNSPALNRASELCSIAFPLVSQKILLLRNYSAPPEGLEIDISAPTEKLKYLSLGSQSVDEIQME